MSGLLGCGKGLCPRMATRLATYNYGNPDEHGVYRTTPMHSCDEHGNEPSEPIPQTEAARKWNRENAHWTDEYDPLRS